MPDAWDFGVGAAVAGWLMDSQTDRIVGELRQLRTPEPPAATPPHPSARLSGWPIDWTAAPLRPGETLERSRLTATIADRLRTGRDLSLQAEPRHRSSDGYPAVHFLDPNQLAFTVLVTHLDPTNPIWVTFEDRPSGFTAARLLPIFDGQGPPGRAYCQLEDPETAVNVVEWGLEQFQLVLQDFSWTMGH
jgi:hypothetical protein